MAVTIGQLALDLSGDADEYLKVNGAGTAFLLSGLVVTSPDGTRFTITVANDGTLGTTAIAADTTVTVGGVAVTVGGVDVTV